MKMKMKNYMANLKTIGIRDTINLLVSFIGIFVSGIQILEIRNNFKINCSRFWIYNITICLVIATMNILNVINRQKQIKNEIHIKSLEESNKNLLEVSDDVRCFKHDFNNIMQAITGYIDVKDMNSLQKYFDELMKDCHHINIMESLNFQVKDNPALYSVLLNKYQIAKENNIVMNISILVNLKIFSEKNYSISRILGILLDNAIEASMESEGKSINVVIIKDDITKSNLIVIENTYSDPDIDTEKIFEKNYTTKDTKRNSGLGLWKIKDIVEKDNKLNLFTSKTEEIFKQKLQVIE